MQKNNAENMHLMADIQSAIRILVIIRQLAKVLK